MVRPPLLVTQTSSSDLTGTSGTSEPDGPDAIRALRSRWRRSQIVAAATALMQQHGFYGMSVNVLAKKADISVGTVYQYVSSKEDILLLVLLDTVGECHKSLDQGMEGIEHPIERLTSGFRQYCREIDARRLAVSLAYRESKTLTREGLSQIKDAEREIATKIADCLVEGKVRGLVEDDCDPLLVSHNLVVLAHMWALKYWALGDHFDLDTYAEAQLDLAFRAVLTPEAWAAHSQAAREGSSTGTQAITGSVGGSA